MASTFTLDDIRAAADAKFGGTVVAGVELRNFIRLDKAERAELKAYQESKDDDNDDELFDRLSTLIRILAADKGAAEQLLNSLNRQEDLLVTIIDKYMTDQNGPKAQ